MNPASFEVTYRGVKVFVEPAIGTEGRWEYIFDHDEPGDWKSLCVGNYPAVSIDVARAAAIEKAKQEYPLRKAQLYRIREHVQKQIAALEAE